MKATLEFDLPSDQTIYAAAKEASRLLGVVLAMEHFLLRPGDFSSAPLEPQTMDSVRAQWEAFKSDAELDLGKLP
jgi:hypothetical protein